MPNNSQDAVLHRSNKIVPVDLPEQLSERDVWVMEALWEFDKPEAISEIYAVVMGKARESAQKAPSFSTLDATLRRLVAAGLVEAHKISHKTVLYSAGATRAQLAVRAFNDVARKFYHRDFQAVIPGLTGAARSSSDSETTNAEMQEILERLENLES